MEGAGGGIAPSSTLYVQNLNEKTKKGPLKQALYHLFSQFGSVKQLTLTKTKKLRGQAWICFSDAAAATLALRDLQGQLLFEKPLKLHFAKDKSHATLRQEGGVPLKRKRQPGAIDEDVGASKAPAAKRAATDAAMAGAGTGAAAPAPVALAPAEPNKMLLAGNLPPELNGIMLRALFGRFPGFVDVRLIPERGLAFVEFADEGSSTVALQGLNNFRLTATHLMSVAYAKK